MKLTIRKKLLGLSFIAIVIPLIISAVVIVFIVTRKTQDESLQKISTNSYIATEQYGSRIQAITNATKELAVTALQYGFTQNLAAGNTSLDMRKAVNILDNFRNYNHLDYLIITDNKGQVIYRVNNPDQKGDNLADQNVMLQDALARNQVIFGSVKLPIDFMSMEKLDNAMNVGNQQKAMEAALAMQVVIPLAVQENELQGAIIAGDVLNNDNTLVDQLKQTIFHDNLEAGSATIYLGDTAIASSRSGNLGRGIGDKVSPEIYNSVLKQGREFIGPETIGTVNYISAYIPIKDISNQIIGIYSVSVQETWFRQFQNWIRNFILAIIGLAIIFSIILTYFAASRLTRPIEAITDAANKISLGDLDVSIHGKAGGDEIEQLGESLERMRISLKSAIERLRRR